VVELEGRLGIVYERIEGRSMLEEVARRPWRLLSLVRQFTDLHLQMHRTVEMRLPSGRELLARLLRESAHLDEETRRWLLERLDALPDADTICHGDFHPDNILISPRGPIVIDWMSVTRGHPLADVAGTFLLLRVAEIPGSVGRILRGLLEMLRNLLLFLYLRRYFEHSPHERREMDDWVPVMAGVYLGQGLTETEEARLIAMIDAARRIPPPRA
jgi:aminoglycoside phosphotransferase (APT) family kinase protein